MPTQKLDVPSYAADDDFSDSGPLRDIGGERMDNKIKDEVTEIFEGVWCPLKTKKSRYHKFSQLYRRNEIVGAKLF